MVLGILEVAAWLLAAWYCIQIAVGRGYSKSKWSFLALFFGPLALIALLFLRHPSHAPEAH